MGIGRVTLCWGIAVGMGLAAVATAIEPGEKPPARQLLEQAWQAEIEGQPAARERLLDACLKEHPQTREARWHAGQVERNGRWIDYADLPDQYTGEAAVREYRQVRRQYARTAEDQLKLANWCRAHRLPEREQAHLTAALELSDDPDDPVLRNRLGFRRVGGTWLTQEDIDELKQSRIDQQRNLRTWQPKIRKLARQLGSRRDAVRREAEAELRAISDRDALPALETVLAQEGMKPARLLVEILGEFPSHQAAEGLARLAVLSPWKIVREDAAKQLRARPFGSYVPELLSTLRTPVAGRIQLLVGQGGVHLLQRFSSETQTAQQVLETRSSRLIRQANRGRGGSAPSSERDRNRLGRTTANAALEAQLRAFESQQALEEQNEQIEDWNRRICGVLGEATGLQLPAEPDPWWSWWGDYNQMTEEEREYEYICYEETELEMVPVSAPITGPPVQGVVAAQPPRECLVAGTPIWTDRGAVPVESVQVGDLVLAQHAETGALSYQPVLRTTIRDEEPVMKVTTAQSQIRATGGHTFWIAGEGWTKLRETQPGQHFHAVTGPVEIQDVEEAGSAKTYNLLVSDTHTYFVGEDLILSHDVTLARPSDALIPGYLP